MTNLKKLSRGLFAASMLATTPVMAQGVYHYPNTGYVTSGYGVRTVPAPGYYSPGYYYGHQFRPGPRVGAFATAPWDDGSSPAYGYGVYGMPY